MSNHSIENTVESIVEPIVQDLGYELYDVQYGKEGKDYYLRITIDTPKGISLEDCEKVNGALDEPLDNMNEIKESYFLEVSSPGIERILRKDWHYERQIGNEIKVKLFKSMDKKKELVGLLKSFDEENLALEIEGEIVTIERKNVAIAKTVCNVF